MILIGSRLFQTEINETSDKTLVGKLQEGDLSAFESLFHKHKRRIYSLCYRLINDAGEAEDLTQEVFLQLFRKIDTFRGESAFSTWLHRLAVNRVLMELRKRVDFQQEWPADRILDFPSPKTKPEAHRSLDKIRLERALAELPPGYRTVLVLHDVEGYDHQEIGDLLGCSIGTSKSQLHKARMKVRELLRR